MQNKGYKIHLRGLHCYFNPGVLVHVYLTSKVGLTSNVVLILSCSKVRSFSIHQGPVIIYHFKNIQTLYVFNASDELQCMAEKYFDGISSLQNKGSLLIPEHGSTERLPFLPKWVDGRMVFDPFHQRLQSGVLLPVNWRIIHIVELVGVRSEDDISHRHLKGGG